MKKKEQTIFILSISSDIGMAITQRYLKAGHRVIGTYRSRKIIDQVQGHPRCHLIPCDIYRRESIRNFLKEYQKLKFSWDVFISSVGDPRPLTSFFQGDFEQWNESVHVNVIEQLRVLHGMYPYRNKKGIRDVVFFAGGGVNNAVTNFSAYMASKSMLIKMCEFLDAENNDLNIFILGPGWTKTKIHDVVLADKDVSKQKKEETLSFLQKKEGTSMQDIFDCIEWLRIKGKKVASGRNFSVVHDPWKGSDSQGLAKALMADPGMYKLKRYRNDWKN